MSTECPYCRQQEAYSVLIDLKNRAVELLRPDGFWHDIDHMHKGWQEERDQWLSDAGLLAIENPDVKSDQQD